MAGFDTDRFIVEIESRPSLWDTRTSEYTDRELKKRCWDEITDIFKHEEDVTTQERKEIGDALQKKWKSIRGCFTRELSRRRALKAGTDGGLRKTEYMYYNQLKFLKTVVTTKDTSPQSEENDSNEYVYVESAPRRHRRDEANDDPDHSHVESKPKRIRRDQLDAATAGDPLEVGQSREANNTTAAEDEDRLFLLSLLSTLKKVPEHKKMTTKIQMMTLLDDATRLPRDHMYIKEEFCGSDAASR